MPKNLECPICEHMLRVNSAQKAPETCPECEQAVEWVPVSGSEAATATREMDVSAEPGPPPILPRKNVAKKTSRSLSPPPPIKPRTRQAAGKAGGKSDGAADVSDSSDDIQLENTNPAKSVGSDSQPVKTIDKPSVSLPTPVLVTLGIATVAVLIAIVYMVVVTTSGNSALSQDNEREKNSTDSNQNTRTNTAAQPPKKDPRDDLNEDEIPTRVSLNTLETVWPKVRSYVVGLYVETAQGPRFASGVVVDSRGWIATSSRVLQGATKIIVTWPNTDFVEGESKSARSEEALGLVAQDLELDIAILAVGRNAIVELTEVETGDSSMIVPSSTLIAAAQPADDRRLWLKDCRVAKRPRFDELHPAFKLILSKASEELPDQQIKFMTHSGTQSPSIAGGPLFDTEGRLVAINTMLTMGSETLAVPATAIDQLKKTATGDLSAFDPAPGGDAVAAMATGDSNVSADANQASVSSFPEILQAKQLIDEARRLGMVPTNGADYQKLVSVAQSLHEISTLRESLSEQPDEQKALDHDVENLINGIIQELSTSGELEFETAKQANQVFLDQHEFGSEEFFAAFVTVKHPTMLSSRINEKSTITFELEGSTQLVTSTANEEADSLIVGAKGLVFGKLRPERYRLTVEGEPQEVIFCEVLYFFEVKRW